MPISKYAKGAQKAYRAMVRKYGAKRGKAIFYAKANKYGKGKSPKAKAGSVYGKGSHRVSRSKKR